MKWAWTQVLILTAGLAPRIARAQGVKPPVTYLMTGPSADVTPVSGQHEFLALIAVIAVTVLALLVIAKTMDYRRKRHEDAIQLEVRISDALLEEPAFIRSSVAPSVHVPFWRGSPATIELHGQVTSRQFAESALRIASKAVSRIRNDFLVENRIAVVPASATRAADIAARARVEAAV